MKEIAVSVTVLATLEVPEAWDEERIDEYIKDVVADCVETSEAFNINDIEWSPFNR